MDYRQLLSEVTTFLQVTLAEEKLSENAEKCRKRLMGLVMARLMIREGSPQQGYMDMNGGNNNTKTQHMRSDSYEEFDIPKSKSQNPVCRVNNLYNDLSTVSKENIYANNEIDAENYINLRHQSQNEDNLYINPSSHLANTPVIPIAIPSSVQTSSNSNSEQNSFISMRKDSDRASDTSSFISSSSQGDESSEVVAQSASALRYAAARSGVLGRRGRFLFLDRTKHYWVAVLQQSLFMYSSDKDNKPLRVIDISGYQARPVAVCNKNNDFKFEIVFPGKNTYQFIAKNQSDMDNWIEAINSVAKIEETNQQLPSPLPAEVALETYDQPDSVIRPVIREAEYEQPGTILRNHAVSESWRNHLSRSVGGDVSRRNSEPRQLPPPPLETYDALEPGLRPVSNIYECFQEEVYHSIDNQQEPRPPKKPSRCLPSLPQNDETYDKPEPKIRPVAQEETVVEDEFYSVLLEPVIKEAVYKNVNENSSGQEEDNNYYNLVPSYPEKEREQESIYNVITEQRPLLTPSPETLKPTKKPPIKAKPVLVSFEKNKEKIKREDKKLSPYVSNMTTIFNNPDNKPPLREVPLVNKISH